MIAPGDCRTSVDELLRHTPEAVLEEEEATTLHQANRLGHSLHLIINLKDKRGELEAALMLMPSV